eukprot:TRINITY_DN10345_c1_g1_i4.p1 TRINITY_DN10345_c1_g1~~TRINITY_DN10345_c1_g1_i4.p1  ORF type:complete len:252 (+),score=-11.35 TRINITY_DN10345_c1_g1_i4:137-892(+)
MVLTQQNVDLSLRQKPRIDYTLYSKQSSKKYIYSTRFRVFAVSAQNRNQTSIQINNQKKNHELSIQYSKPGENSASEQDSKQRPKPFQNISDMMVQFFKNRKSFERKFEELFEKSFQLEIDEQLEKQLHIPTTHTHNQTTLPPILKTTNKQEKHKQSTIMYCNQQITYLSFKLSFQTKFIVTKLTNQCNNPIKTSKKPFQKKQENKITQSLPNNLNTQITYMFIVVIIYLYYIFVLFFCSFFHRHPSGPPV